MYYFTRWHVCRSRQVKVLAIATVVTVLKENCEGGEEVGCRIQGCALDRVTLNTPVTRITQSALHSYFAAPVRLMNLSDSGQTLFLLLRDHIQVRSGDSGQVRNFEIVGTHGLTNGHSSHIVQQVSDVAGELSLGLVPSKDAYPGLSQGDWQTVP